MSLALRHFVCVLLTSVATAQQPNSPAEPAAPQLPDDPFAALAAMPSEAPVRDGLEVLVRDADGAPVKDAIVVMTVSSSADYAAMRVAAEQRYPGDEPRILAARATRGVRYAVSANGTTRVPIDARGRLVATHGELLASVVRDNVGAAGGRRVELQLLPPQRCAVEVVTADGEPAGGVLVGLLTAPGEFPFPQQTTGPDGKAVFFVVPGRGEQAVVQALIAADAPPMEKLTSDEAGVRLQLPPCGSIVARLGIELLPGAEVTWMLRNEQGLNARPTATPSPGQARFDHVAAGFQGVLRCSVDGVGYGGEDRRGTPIPTLAAGEQRELDIAGTGVQRDLVVRLLAPDGQPLRSSYLIFEWSRGNGSSRSSARTNREGWLQLGVDDDIGATSTLRITARTAGWNGTLLGAATIELGELKERRNVLADQRLTAPTIALTGRIVTTDGRAPTGLALQARRADNHDSYEVPVDANGRFAVSMVEPHPQQIAIQVDSEEWGFVDNPGEAQLCDRGGDVQLRVQRSGRVRFSSNGLPDDLHSTFDSYWERAENRERVDVDLATDSGLLTAPPGDWSLVIAYGDQEIHRIDDIRIASGIETHDARLMFFDWKAFAAVVSIRVQDEKGQPTDACTVWYHYQNGATGTSPNNGLSRWLVPKRGAHMTIDADGSGEEIDLGQVDGGDLVVRFGKGPRLLVALAAAPTLPDGVVLVAAAEGQEHWQPFASDATAELWAGSVGGCRPRLAVQKGQQRVPVEFRLARAELPRGGARLDVAADEALTKAIEAAVRSLR
ncbi:MAG: hypothetical protein R3F29_13585 [Planctomycetota bacterium]